MASFSKTGRSLESSVARYWVNHFVMHLDADVPYFRRGESGPTQDPNFLQYYVHEYVHYWHNTSTVAGLRSFIWTQSVLRVVSVALLRAGERVPTHIAYTSEECEALRRMMEYRGRADGEKGVTLAKGEHVQPTIKAILGITEQSATATFLQRSFDYVFVVLQLQVRDRAGNVWVADYTFGQLAIEESVAIAMQSIVEDATALGGSMLAPELPYRVAERLYLHVVGKEPTPTMLMVVGTLALCGFDPAAEYLAILRQISTLPESPIRVLEERIAAVQGNLVALAGVIDSDLKDLIEGYLGRGPVEEGIRFVAETFARTLQRRLQNPVFDVEVLVTNPGLLMAEYDPCDAFQEMPGDIDLIGRDLHVSAGHGTGMRALHCQQHFADTQTAEALGNAKPEDRRCPMWSVCDLPFRVNDASICAESPWLRANQQVSCAYGVGVNALRGTLHTERLPRRARSG